MNTIAIVATGPSAEGCGAEIDACDFVVRISSWITQGATGAGVKVSALAGWGPPAEVAPEMLERRDWEFWFLIPLDSVRIWPKQEDPGDIPYVLNLIDGRPLRMARRCVNSRVETYLNTRRPRPRWSRCSQGMSCVAMAQDLALWDEYHLWGFDRRGSGGSADGYAQAPNFPLPATDADAHDWTGEKLMFAEWADALTWCGEPVRKGRLVWHGRPHETIRE